MTISANVTTALIGTGAWVHIASGGDVLVSSSGGAKWALTATDAAPLAAVYGHDFAHLGFGAFAHDMALSGQQRLWVKIPTGSSATVTATDPA